MDRDLVLHRLQRNKARLQATGLERLSLFDYARDERRGRAGRAWPCAPCGFGWADVAEIVAFLTASGTLDAAVNLR